MRKSLLEFFNKLMYFLSKITDFPQPKYPFSKQNHLIYAKIRCS